MQRLRGIAANGSPGRYHMLCRKARDPDPCPQAGAQKEEATGLALEIPEGFEGQVRPRSGLALKKGVTVANAPGTIDSDYRGELGVILVNLGDAPVEVPPGHPRPQLVIAPRIQARKNQAETQNDPARGAGGFGSTGVSDVKPC